MNRELTDLGSSRVQTSTWIRFIQSLEDDFRNVIGVDRADKAFNSWMTDIFQGSDLNEIVMFTHMKTQIEDLALANSRFRFNEILFLDVNFHQLNLTRSSSCLPLPDQLANKRAVINPKNENDDKCFIWAVIAALHYVDIKSDPERISNLRKYVDNYNWSKFPLSVKGIREFEKKNDVIVNILGVEKKKKVYILRGKKYDYRKRVVNLLLIDNGEQRHYTAIKSLSRLLRSSNTKHNGKQHFCLNC